ncbi:hypothetical protein CFter6_0153 [Collimonas fungivorans]|uniref:DUF885 domain-containing protein n=1 Tax=Collimonas fungivorans TaxID=158899 RepID=A0A127P5C8_9BURK|nr:DUF885 family protein [Collimonas fungivorans]AMO92884.1 hypothetical protein CFter6_0153 [Collimonas fungivorans]
MNDTPPTFSRRELLLSALSAAAVAALPLPRIAGAQAKEALPADAQFSTLLADFAEEILRLSPTSATALGLDSGSRSGLKSRLQDASPAGDAAWASQVKSMLARLAPLERNKLSPDAQVRYDSVQYAASSGVDGLRFSYGGAASGFYGGTSPFPVTQQDGALTAVPEFLDSQHKIANAADAEAYLERVTAMARLLDQETARIAEQAAKGIMPPDFIAHTALGQLRNYRKTPAAAQKLVTSITGRTRKLGIEGDWEARATKLVNTLVYPALERQIDTFAKTTAKATDVAGVQRLPDGAAYYEWALKLGTTTTHGASEIHTIGLEQNKMLQARIDAILKVQGITQGTVGERILALSKDPSRFYADDDQGRAQLIAYCNERVAAIRTLMPKISHLGLQAPLVIKRVPPDIEAGAALGYMNFAALDGSRPAIYYINLKSTKLWPKSEIATLTAHEGIPGHTWQGAYLAEHHAQIPLITSLMGFNAFVEGWALYAEQLVDEFGLYATDPFSQVGYLQAQQFRACRLVVDTGLHSMQWTRQQAIQFLVENTGRGQAAMTSEIDRYCVMPGQACGYKMGHNEILRQRERAKTALGGKFDLAAFNDALVKCGGVPLTVLPTVIDRYIAATRTA